MPATPPRIKDFAVCNVAACLRKQRTEIKEGTSIVESFSRKSLLNRRQISIFLPSALYHPSKEASAYVFHNIFHKYHTPYGKLKNPRTCKVYVAWKKYIKSIQSDTVVIIFNSRNLSLRIPSFVDIRTFTEKRGKTRETIERQL